MRISGSYVLVTVLFSSTDSIFRRRVIMRFANILLFVAAALLGITLSAAAVWKLPFSVFTITEDHFGSVIKLLETDFAPDKFYAAEALKDIVQWGDTINFVFATVCAVLAVMPALFTIRWAESKLFERTAVIGWNVIKFMAVLGAFVVALWPVPMAGMIYVSLCAILICGYIVTYQWPKKYHDGHNERGHESSGRKTMRHAHH